MARSTAALWPLTTTCPPPLSLATATISPWAASVQASWAWLEFNTEQGGHGANADRHRLLHGLAAQLQKSRGVCELQRPGGGQGGIFTERVACDMGRKSGQRLASVLFQGHA